MAWPIQNFYKRSNVGQLISVVVFIPLPEVNVTLNLSVYTKVSLIVYATVSGIYRQYLCSSNPNPFLLFLVRKEANGSY